MAKATITISDEINRLAETRAAAAGYSSVGEYVEALILADAVSRSFPNSKHIL